MGWRARGVDSRERSGPAGLIKREAVAGRLRVPHLAAGAVHDQAHGVDGGFDSLMCGGVTSYELAAEFGVALPRTEYSHVAAASPRARNDASSERPDAHGDQDERRHRASRGHEPAWVGGAAPGLVLANLIPSRGGGRLVTCARFDPSSLWRIATRECDRRRDRVAGTALRRGRPM